MWDHCDRRDHPVAESERETASTRHSNRSIGCTHYFDLYIYRWDSSEERTCITLRPLDVHHGPLCDNSLSRATIWMEAFCSSLEKPTWIFIAWWNVGTRRLYARPFCLYIRAAQLFRRNS